MNELKPCPFCGGNATLWSDGYMEYVECDVCGAKSQSCYDPQLAVRKWSTRADDYKQAAEYWQRMYEQTFVERTCHSERSDGWECSECGFLDAYTTADFINYCPNCGARVTPKNSETTPKVVSE